MALLMGATMAVVMLACMLHIYQRRGLNLAIFAISAVVFAASLWLVRKLAKGSAETQRREMAEMEALIKELEAQGR